MSRPTVLLLCGHIGAGKTTVGHFFTDFGAHVVSADAISHDILAHNGELIDKVRSAFGQSVFDGKSISRKKLAQLVFSRPEKLRLLEDLEIPYIVNEIQKQIASSSSKVVVIELSVPQRALDLLKGADGVIVVESPKASLEERVMARDGSSENVSSRIKYQPESAWLKEHADATIINDATLAELKAKAYAAYAQLVEGKVSES